jgi:hypothetical protein
MRLDELAWLAVNMAPISMVPLGLFAPRARLPLIILGGRTTPPDFQWRPFALSPLSFPPLSLSLSLPLPFLSTSLLLFLS